jgi:hypothetical protein
MVKGLYVPLKWMNYVMRCAKTVEYIVGSIASRGGDVTSLEVKRRKDERRMLCNSYRIVVVYKNREVISGLRSTEKALDNGEKDLTGCTLVMCR